MEGLICLCSWCLSPLIIMIVNISCTDDIQRKRWLDGITKSMDMNVSKLWEMVKDTGVLAHCSPWGCRVGHDWVNELNWLILCLVYSFPKAAVTNYHRFSGLKHETFVPSQSWRPVVWNPDASRTILSPELWGMILPASSRFWWLQVFLGLLAHHSSLSLIFIWSSPWVRVTNLPRLSGIRIPVIGLRIHQTI